LDLRNVSGGSGVDFPDFCTKVIAYAGQHMCQAKQCVLGVYHGWDFSCVEFLTLVYMYIRTAMTC